MCGKKPLLREFHPGEAPQSLGPKERLAARRVLAHVRATERTRRLLVAAGHPAAQVDGYMMGMRKPLEPERATSTPGAFGTRS